MKKFDPVHVACLFLTFFCELCVGKYMQNLLGIIAVRNHSIGIWHRKCKKCKNIKIKKTKLSLINFSWRIFFDHFIEKNENIFFQTMVVNLFEFHFEVRFEICFEVRLKVNGYGRPRSVDRIRLFTLIFTKICIF